ncbi:hypothetical protein FDG2_2854 [Candidatus Protofrankia californiensis]|uniref:Uncharacterized protein n=1 Tax=Candidatus Protofrankia californiensis TaxID=1839754 RepID=A0A1C3NYI5_9ACTN|nr:hypothetical protein FDG2_2854 [Candidatus Protofrankia californiensis]
MSIPATSWRSAAHGRRQGVRPRPVVVRVRGVVDLDSTTLGSLLAHKIVQDGERETLGPAWSNGALPDEHGNLVQLSGLMFTSPDGRYLTPEYVTRRMQQIARRAGLCTTVRELAAAGAVELIVGTRYTDPVGEWTLYRDREPIGEVTAASVEGVRGGRVRLGLAEPLPVDVEVGAELDRVCCHAGGFTIFGIRRHRSSSPKASTSRWCRRGSVTQRHRSRGRCPSICCGRQVRGRRRRWRPRRLARRGVGTLRAPPVNRGR